MYTICHIIILKIKFNTSQTPVVKKLKTKLSTPKSFKWNYSIGR